MSDDLRIQNGSVTPAGLTQKTSQGNVQFFDEGLTLFGYNLLDIDADLEYVFLDTTWKRVRLKTSFADLASRTSVVLNTGNLATYFNFTASAGGGTVTSNTLVLTGQNLVSTVNGVASTAAVVPITSIVAGNNVTTTSATGVVTVNAIRNVRFADAITEQSINLTNPGTAFFGGRTVTQGQIVFCPFQGTLGANGLPPVGHIDNGLYTFDTTSTPMVRVATSNTSPNILNTTVLVRNGSLNFAQSTWVNTNTSLALGTDTVTYVQFNKPLQRQADYIQTSNVSVTSAPTQLDGITASAGKVAVLGNQNAPIENGEYYYQGAALPMIRMPNYLEADVLKTTHLVTDSDPAVLKRGAIYASSLTTQPTFGTTAMRFEWRAGYRPINTNISAFASALFPIHDLTTGASNTVFTIAFGNHSPSFIFEFRKADAGAGNVVVTPTPSQTIQGAATYSVVGQNAGARFRLIGSNYTRMENWT